MLEKYYVDLDVGCTRSFTVALHQPKHWNTCSSSSTAQRRLLMLRFMAQKKYPSAT